MEWFNASNLSFPWQQKSHENLSLMKELYWRPGVTLCLRRCLSVVSFPSPQIPNSCYWPLTIWLGFGYVCYYTMHGLYRISKWGFVFSALTRGTSHDTSMIWESNKHDLISAVRVCDKGWYEYANVSGGEEKIRQCELQITSFLTLCCW